MSAVMSRPAVMDVAVLGAGVMGSTAALFLARQGRRVALIDRKAIFREASGVNAGTLTLNMTRAALVPHALKGREMWLEARNWLGRDVGAVATPGLSLAFTEAECALLEERAAARREMGAPISVVGAARALEVEPGLNTTVRAAAYCPLDGFIPAYGVGRGYCLALHEAGVEIMENSAVDGIARAGGHYEIVSAGQVIARARSIVLAGGAWLERMMAWLGLRMRVKCLVNQLVVTERLPPVMGSVVSIANGLLSLKQFVNGTVVMGGGWQGRGNVDTGETSVIPANLVGNVRLASFTIPRLSEARIARIWLGFESETDDAMPAIGPIPGWENAFVIGCVHSGFTSGPYMGRLLAQAMDGQAVDLKAFDPARLLLSLPSAHKGFCS